MKWKLRNYVNNTNSNSENKQISHAIYFHLSDQWNFTDVLTVNTFVTIAELLVIIDCQQSWSHQSTKLYFLTSDVM